MLSPVHKECALFEHCRGDRELLVRNGYYFYSGVVYPGFNSLALPQNVETEDLHRAYPPGPQLIFSEALFPSFRRTHSLGFCIAKECLWETLINYRIRQHRETLHILYCLIMLQWDHFQDCNATQP